MNVADFDRNGKPDIAVVGAAGSSIEGLTILLNTTTR